MARNSSDYAGRIHWLNNTTHWQATLPAAWQGRLPCQLPGRRRARAAAPALLLRDDVGIIGMDPSGRTRGTTRPGSDAGLQRPQR